MKMHPEYFRQKKILDIGCNSGYVTINLAKSLLPLSVLGIDIDGNLIDAARKNLQREKTDFSLSDDEILSLSKVIFRKVSLGLILIQGLVEINLISSHRQTTF